MIQRLSIISLIVLGIALSITIAAYAVYPEEEPPAYDVAAPLTGEQIDTPLRGLAKAVSRSAYELGYIKVEGEPRLVASHMHMSMVEVSGYVLMPAPGVWIVEGGEQQLHPMQVMRLLSKASYVSAEGRPAEAFMPGLGRVQILVAYKLSLKVDGEKVVLAYAGPLDEWEGMPRWGEHGPGHGMPGMPGRGGGWWQEP